MLKQIGNVVVGILCGAGLTATNHKEAASIATSVVLHEIGKSGGETRTCAIRDRGSRRHCGL